MYFNDKKSIVHLMNASQIRNISNKYNIFVFLFAALLSGTLRTFQKTTCDSEKVSLGCPRGTSISIELAQYEKNGLGMCSNLKKTSN